MEIKQRLHEFLTRHQTVTACVSETDGRPYAAALFYAADDELNLYVVSDPSTRHGRAMLDDGHVAGTIQKDGQDWQNATGIQFEGTCRRLTGAERRRGWSVYMKRFGFLEHVAMQGIGPLAAALARIDLWRIEPGWIRLIDNGVAFAHKEEWRRAARKANT